jgi:hypothetical protein
MSSTSWQERRAVLGGAPITDWRSTVLGGALTTDWRRIWRTILFGVLTTGLIVLAIGLAVVLRQEQQLRSRLGDETQSIRFVHDLTVLCSYDRHFCIEGKAGASPVLAGILRRAGVGSVNLGRSNDR